MKRIIVLMMFAFLFSHSSLAKVDDNELSKIYTLVADKKYAEALAAHQQYFKDAKGTSYAAVRLSFGLASWADLGKAYPPAHMALVQLAVERKAIIHAGTADFDTLQEYVSINSYINRQNDSVETFLFVSKKYPEQAQHFYSLVKDILIANERYDIVKKYADDPILEFENLRFQREHSLGYLRKKSEAYTLEQINSDFDKKYQALLKTAEKIGLYDEAEEIKRRYDGYMKGNLLRKYH